MKKMVKVRRLVALMLTVMITVGMLSNPVEVYASTTYTLKVNTNGYFEFKNVGSGKYLNVYCNRSANKTNIDVYSRDNTSGQKFKLVKSGAGYLIIPQCATSKVLNLYTAKNASNNTNCCLWSKTYDSTQIFIPEYNEKNNAFILRSANNKNLVLCAVGSKNSSNVCVRTYKQNDKYQLWTSSALSVVKSTSSKSAATVTKSVSQISNNVNKATSKATQTVNSQNNMYKYNNTTFYVVKNSTKYTGVKYRQSTYSSDFLYSCCMSTAAATYWSIVKNTPKVASDYHTATSKKGSYIQIAGTTNSASSNIYNKTLELLKSGKPVLMNFNTTGKYDGRSNYQHWVTIIGYSNGNKADRYSLLCIDPYDGSIKTLDMAMTLEENYWKLGKKAVPTQLNW